MFRIVKKINLVFLLLLPFIDVITALITRYDLFPISLGVITKALYSLLLLVYILFFSKSKYKKTFIKYLVCIFIFCLIYIISKPHIWSFRLLLKEVINLYKYLFTGYLFFSFLVLNDDFKYDSKFYRNIMLYTLVIYSLFMIIPYITGTSFNTYVTKPNLGKIGWFYSGNEVSAIFVTIFPFFFLKLKEMEGKNRYYYLLLLLIIIPSILMIGTKVSWYGIVLLVGVMTLIAFIKNKKNRFFITCMLCIFGSMCLLTFFSPTNLNVNKSIDEIKTINSSSKNNSKTVNKVKKVDVKATSNKVSQSTVQSCGKMHKLNEVIKNKTIYRIINVTLSGRQNSAYTLFLIYKDSSMIDKLFGIGFTNNEDLNNCYVEKFIEMDPIDIFIHYGVLGFIVMLLPFFYLIKKIDFRNIKKYSYDKLVYLVTLGLLLILSLLSGHIIGYPACSIYLVILMILIYNSCVKERIK